MIDFKNLKLNEKIEKKKENELVIKDNVEEIFPTTDFKCPKCGNDKAYIQSYQFSRSDEGMTNFLRCTKCGYTIKFR